MREQTLSTLEVFRYASVEKTDVGLWDKAAIQRIETQIKKDVSLGRLSALILKKAVDNQQLSWFSQSTQMLLKATATKLVIDVAAKKLFINQLVPLLELHNIPIVLLKGMAFNHYLYDDNAPRGVSDIDILIRPEHKERFEAVFIELATCVESEKKHAFDDLYEQTWRSNNNQHLIDVHTHLTNPHLFDICLDELWARSTIHPAYSTEHVRVLGAEDTMCHLVTHMINDTDFYHYNLIDVHVLLLEKTINCELLAATAKKWGVLNATQLILKAGHDYVHSPLLIINSEQSLWLLTRAKLASLIVNKLFTLPSHDKSVLHRFKQLCCYLFVVDKGALVFKMSLLYLQGLTKK